MTVPKTDTQTGPIGPEKNISSAPIFGLVLGAELAAKLNEELFYVMESPVLRVAGYDMPYPPARVEGEYLPSVDRILYAVDRSLAY